MTNLSFIHFLKNHDALYKMGNVFRGLYLGEVHCLIILPRVFIYLARFNFTGFCRVSKTSAILISFKLLSTE